MLLLDPFEASALCFFTQCGRPVPRPVHWIPSELRTRKLQIQALMVPERIAKTRRSCTSRQDLPSVFSLRRSRVMRWYRRLRGCPLLSVGEWLRTLRRCPLGFLLCLLPGFLLLHFTCQTGGCSSFVSQFPVQALDCQGLFESQRGRCKTFPPEQRPRNSWWILYRFRTP